MKIEISNSLRKNILKIFGERVRLKRNELGVSQESLADLAGLHRTYIGSVERGERNVSLINVFRISIALRCPVSNLISDDLYVKNSFK